MGEPQITTGTMWNRGANLCTAVMLRSFIDLLKLDGGHRNLNALNDCAIVISVDDATAEAPMLARRVNGAPLTVREKGPIWA
ncbi:MAG: oxidoreductase, partial [Candidatus Saccharibacteria bacterium]|nr:oxidoreductase [Pseudorhodobacter sp.]